MTRVKIVPVLSGIPALSSLKPRQRGPGSIEALSSHMIALAHHHSCSPYTLIHQVLIPPSQQLSPRWRRVRFNESQLVNGYLDVAHYLAEAVVNCTHRTDIKSMTLIGMHTFCDPVGKHVLRRVRPWCPECYREARARDIAPWDPLYTYLNTTTACFWHQAALRAECEKCGGAQRFVPKMPFLDLCERCGADLATQSNPPLKTGRASDDELWFSRAAMHLIETLQSGVPLSADNFAKNIQLLIARHFDGNRQQFAKKLGVAGSGPKNWIDRGSHPSWASIADLGFRMEIPPTQLATADLPMTDPVYWRYVGQLVLDAPHIRPASETLEAAREALTFAIQMARADPTSIPDSIEVITKKIGVRRYLLKRHFPDEFATLVDLRYSAVRSLTLKAATERHDRLANAVENLATIGKLPTSRRLKLEADIKISDVIPRRTKA